MKEVRSGYVWNETLNGGFWSKVKNKGGNNNRLPFFCPHCSKISGSVDDEYFVKYGFCYECFTMYVDSRQTPAIDLEKYRPR